MSVSTYFKNLFYIYTSPKNKKAAEVVLLGAICGDIIGSYYESNATKDLKFSLFTPYSRITDDTVCSIGIADALVQREPFAGRLQFWCRKYPRAGYGGMFRNWIYSDTMEPYKSWGNGSAMRVSAVGASATSIEEVLRLAKESAEITHNHPEGIKGAQAVALAIWLSLFGYNKQEIQEEIEKRFDYNLHRQYKDIHANYGFDVSCQGSVPEAIICFLESEDYESAVRYAVALGGDADTMAAIAGSIAAAFYGEIPAHILIEANKLIPDEMNVLINKFNKKIK